MKRSPEEKQLRERLSPSKFSGEGFLGGDDRPVDEIISADLRILEEMGVTREELVSALRKAYAEAESAFGAAVEYRPGITAVHFESRGWIPSPFRGEGRFRKGEVLVTNHRTGSTILITPLSIHLIEAHGFFQGRGARYRLDPERTVETLELRPGR
jgi:hypothetical protein